MYCQGNMFRPFIGSSSVPLEIQNQIYLRFLCIMGSHMLTGFNVELWGTWVFYTSIVVEASVLQVYIRNINPYPTAFPYGNGMVLHFYQQQESSTTKTVNRVINKGLKAYV